MAGHSDVRHLSGYAAALSRPSHGQRPGRGRPGSSSLRSPPAFHCQLSDDVCLRAHRGRHWDSDSAAHLPTAEASAGALGLARLSGVAATACGPVSRNLQFIAARVARFVGKQWSWRLVRFTAAFGLQAWELLFISAIMQMGLALPMAYYFHRATTKIGRAHV